MVTARNDTGNTFFQDCCGVVNVAGQWSVFDLRQRLEASGTCVKRIRTKGAQSCNCNSIAEDILLDCLIRKIEELYLSDDAIERLRIAISDQLQEERPPVVDLAALRKKLSDVEKQIAVGSERV